MQVIDAEPLLYEEGLVVLPSGVVQSAEVESAVLCRTTGLISRIRHDPSCASLQVRSWALAVCLGKETGTNTSRRGLTYDDLMSVEQ